jgi:hypothetical protein
VLPVGIESLPAIATFNKRIDQISDEALNHPAHSHAILYE